MQPRQNVKVHKIAGINLKEAWHTVVLVASVICVLGLAAAHVYAMPVQASHLAAQEAQVQYLGTHYDLGANRMNLGSEFPNELEGSIAARRGSEAPCTGFCERR